MKTRLTELLGIRYPIVQASMAWIGDAGLAGAVSLAGGLGTIGPNAGARTVTAEVGETGERLRGQIQKIRGLTDRPFAVNFTVGAGGQDRDFSDRCVAVGIEEKVPVAIVSQGSPQVYTERLKKAGITVMQVCSTVRHARKAEAAGVDAVITSGTEGGGHSGFDQLTTLTLVPQVADAIRLPVAAGGGIGDARGLVAALALGAEGIYMGTRFIATQECPAHENTKRLILEARDTDTVSVSHGARVQGREDAVGDRGFVEERRGSVRLVLNDFLRNIIREKGTQHALDDDSFNFMRPYISGDVTRNTITAGQVAGLIRDLPTCRDLIEGMIREAGPILDRLTRVYRTPR